MFRLEEDDNYYIIINAKTNKVFVKVAKATNDKASVMKHFGITE